MRVTSVQNVRTPCSKCPVNLFKMSAHPVQNVRRCKITLVILFFKITLVISGVIRTSSHTHYRLNIKKCFLEKRL